MFLLLPLVLCSHPPHLVRVRGTQPNKQRGTGQRAMLNGLSLVGVVHQQMHALIHLVTLKRLEQQ